ncbi:MAG: hypothetical protein GY796_11680 [Chloroflexi bacterium]|nr:hypothetical protein [Chloroflexota bacterium]
MDVSAVADFINEEAITEHWDWITSGNRVQEVEINVEEENGDAMQLFIVLKNDNYPQLNISFWIRWQGEKWEALESPN